LRVVSQSLKMSQKRIAEFSPISEVPQNKRVDATIDKVIQPPSKNKILKTPPVAKPPTEGKSPPFATPGQNDSPNSTVKNKSKEFLTPEDRMDTENNKSKDRFEKSVENRLENSMRKIPETEKDTYFQAPAIDYVVIDIFKKNGRQFDDILPRDCLKQVWSEIGQESSEIRILSFESFKNKFLRVYYRLRKEVHIKQITKCLETEIELTIGTISYVFEIRFPQFRELICDLNHPTQITFYKVPPNVSIRDLRDWIHLFGRTLGSFRFVIFSC
jgi:hypothetical protein